MFIPNKTKYRKSQKGNKGKIRNLTYACASMHKGEFGLKAMEPGRISSTQIEAARLAIRRKLEERFKRKDTFIDIRFFPNKPISKKAIGVRMGGGKGAPEFWVSIINPGRILFEIGGNINMLTNEQAREILEAGAYKLPIKTRVVSRLF